MIAELGLAALWLAAGLCVLQFLAGAAGARGEEQGALSALVRPAAVVQGADSNYDRPPREEFRYVPDVASQLLEG